jgi:3-oxoacid CoA-transferase subunit A
METKIMKTKFYITGDIHGDLSRFDDFEKSLNHNIINNLIVLGDSGFLYHDYFSRQAIYMRERAKGFSFNFYIVRGNHEDRPENVPALTKLYDSQILGEVYVDEAYPSIRYLLDGAIYNFGGQNCLILGGAYSVDKQYRLMRGWKWFPEEQLANEEMTQIYKNCKDKQFDFILSHTCPYSWRPTHMFLSMIDQETVDTSMEEFFEKYKNEFHFDMWLWGHYHENCVCDKKGVMLYDAIYDLAMCKTIDEYTEYDGDYMTFSPQYSQREDI